MSNGTYMEMNTRYLTHDLEHQQDHRYDPSDLATGAERTTYTIDSCMRSKGGEVADILSQLLVQEGIESVAGVVTKSEAIDAQTLSAIIQEMTDGQVDVPYETLKPPSRRGGSRST